MTDSTPDTGHERQSAACEHESASFDRTLCGCGSMHDYCDECGKALDCPLNAPDDTKKVSMDHSAGDELPAGGADAETAAISSRAPVSSAAKRDGSIWPYVVYVVVALALVALVNWLWPSW